MGSEWIKEFCSGASVRASHMRREGCKCADVGGSGHTAESRGCQMVGHREPHPFACVSRAGQHCFRYGKCAEGPGYL